MGVNQSVNISKSSRHSKITGDFAEALVLYWLSKYGFECARIDHTGIDLIAKHPNHSEWPMGISVKSRSRNAGAETTALSIDRKNFTLAEKACEAFGCDPYFAFVIDAGGVISGYILPLHRVPAHAPLQTKSHWRMTKTAVAGYANDPEIKCFQMKCEMTRWWS